jgi:hypothetical protein
MRRFKKIVLPAIPVFLLFSFFATPAFAGKKYQKNCPDKKERSREHVKGPYPDHDHTRTPGGQDKPTIEGGVNIGFGSHTSFL